jgi:hypothetical protein
LWNEEWARRVSSYPLKFEEKYVNAKRTVLCKDGENISDCASIMPSFSLFGLANRSDLLGTLDHEAQGRLGQNLCMQVQGSYPGSQGAPQICDSRALGSLLTRTSKGTLLEPDAEALDYIVAQISSELKFVKEDWSGALWQEAVMDTAKAQALAHKGLMALEPFSDRLRAAVGNPFVKRELLEEALRECTTHIPRGSVQAFSGDAFTSL